MLRWQICEAIMMDLTSPSPLLSLLPSSCVCEWFRIFVTLTKLNSANLWDQLWGCPSSTASRKNVQMYAMEPVQENNFSVLSYPGYKWDVTTNIVLVSRLTKNVKDTFAFLAPKIISSSLIRNSRRFLVNDTNGYKLHSYYVKDITNCFLQKMSKIFHSHFTVNFWLEYNFK